MKIITIHFSYKKIENTVFQRNVEYNLLFLLNAACLA